jgi:hypothetical protein
MTLPETTGSADPIQTWAEYSQLATEAPGVDPLDAILTSRPEDVPRYGYLVTASMQPGLRAGTIQIEKYDAIRFEDVESSDEFGTRYGTRHIPGITHSAVIRCGTDVDVLGGELTDDQRGAFTSSGGRVTELSDRVVVAERMHVDTVIPRELASYDPRLDQYLGEHPAADTSIVRAVRTVEEAVAVLTAVGGGLGLRHGDFQGFMNAGIDRLATMVNPDTVEYHRLRELIRVKDGTEWLRRLGSVIKGEVEL